jgi:hypothetical protein
VSRCVDQLAYGVHGLLRLPQVLRVIEELAALL